MPGFYAAERLVQSGGAGRPRHAGPFAQNPSVALGSEASSTSKFCQERDRLANGGPVDHNM
jgi:hypothetical protein